MKKILFLMLGIALAVVSCNKEGKEPNIPPEIKDTIPNTTDTIPEPLYPEMPVYPEEPDSFIIMTGCDSLPKAIRFDSIPEQTGLAGTKWRLWGVLDVATCKLSLLRPRACEECFTLNFITDSTASGRTTSLNIFINIRREGSCMVEDIGETFGDGYTYRGIIACKRSYVISKDEFRIICYLYGTEEEKHLIFKKTKS